MPALRQDLIFYYYFIITDNSNIGVGDLEITPVSAAIARYLGIDLTAEGRAARNRRGIALVVHGAPLSGKTATAVSLAKMYGAALLTVDGVVIEAISSGNTSAGKDQWVCSSAAVKRSNIVVQHLLVQQCWKAGWTL